MSKHTLAAEIVRRIPDMAREIPENNEVVVTTLIDQHIQMSDSELVALAAIANAEAVMMAGDNQIQKMRGESPHFAAGYGMMPAGSALYDELIRRGILK